MTEHEDDDNDNNEVKIIETTSEAEKQKTDYELIITTGGREYDELFIEQWTLIDIIDKENKDDERNTEVPVDADIGGKEQQMMR